VAAAWPRQQPRVLLGVAALAVLVEWCRRLLAG
jgi:hypothetical protein